MTNNEIGLVGHNWGSGDAFTVGYTGEGAAERVNTVAFTTPNTVAFMKVDGEWSAGHYSNMERWPANMLEKVAEKTKLHDMEDLRQEEAQRKSYFDSWTKS